VLVGGLPRAALYVSVILLAAVFFAPLFWTISTSLKRPDEVFLFPPTPLPETPRFVNYVQVFEKIPFGLFTRNSALVTLTATVGTVLSTTLVAYGFARKRFPGRDVMFLLVLSTMMLPIEVTIIPQFLLFKELGWIDTLLPLVVPEYFAVGAFYIFLMRQFLMTIPRDFDEAATMDGAGSLRILWSVLLPLIRPALITVAILSFLAHWNDFFAPMIYLNSKENLTLTVGLRYLVTTVGANTSDKGEPMEHLLMAASLMAALPAILLFFVAQRYFVQGIVMSGIKG
jgi:ABC-type glycerol-3-phosphate transport system permease component